jgi:hypothetical protein
LQQQPDALGEPTVRKSAQTPLRIIFALLLVGAIISTSPTFAQPGLDGPNAANPAQDRLGKDDGYAIAIHYSGDLHGSLETCG